MADTEVQPGLRIALFGGTFDPVHNAHLTIAREAAVRFRLDRVLFVTAGNPPHKAPGTTTSFEHRHRMVELACAADSRFVASRLEQGPGKSYSIDTIEQVRKTLAAGDDLFFLIGADAFAEIGAWFRSDEVIKAAGFIVVSRPGYDYPVPAGARVHRLETLALPVSSSRIREGFQNGACIQDAPEAVVAYARANGLYSPR
ncbi:MAG: nicotinate (nicotinamide) nucleotide adenylyltransferase [Candidatus Solibacter sp.]|nr:nicotinate (nicotinamide) nucleotide adenylyltransferase [Candidatus Solibacter sp.]